MRHVSKKHHNFIAQNKSKSVITSIIIPSISNLANCSKQQSAQLFSRRNFINASSRFENFFRDNLESARVQHAGVALSRHCGDIPDGQQCVYVFVCCITVVCVCVCVCMWCESACYGRLCQSE